MPRSVIFLLPLLLVLKGCTVNYSFSGASIDPKMKTYSVQYFANRAPIVVPTLSQQLTEVLREKIRSQTKLRLVTGVGDADFSGEITRYETRAVAITGNDRPAQNRLTIDVRVRYTNSVNPKESFESTFSRYKDYDANQSLASVEQDLIKDILELLTEDIFNKAFVNW